MLNMRAVLLNAVLLGCCGGWIVANAAVAAADDPPEERSDLQVQQLPDPRDPAVARVIVPIATPPPWEEFRDFHAPGPPPAGPLRSAEAPMTAVVGIADVPWTAEQIDAEGPATDEGSATEATVSEPQTPVRAGAAAQPIVWSGDFPLYGIDGPEEPFTSDRRRLPLPGSVVAESAAVAIATPLLAEFRGSGANSPPVRVRSADSPVSIELAGAEVPWRRRTEIAGEPEEDVEWPLHEPPQVPWRVMLVGGLIAAVGAGGFHLIRRRRRRSRFLQRRS
jgi:hypothetical protein